jgi:hypothetical protein
MSGGSSAWRRPRAATSLILREVTHHRGLCAVTWLDDPDGLP